MTRLLYIANIRLPTEKAHGLQIIQNCEAFANAGAEVTLWVAQRVNTPEMRAVKDPWQYYGVKRNFDIRWLPCLDLLPLVPGHTNRLAQLIFYLQLWTFTLVAVLRALGSNADLYYSRDAFTLSVLGLFKPREKLVYEAHRLGKSRAGLQLKKQVAQRTGLVVAITEKLAHDLQDIGFDPDRILVAHDGIRAARFANLPSREDARRLLGWNQEMFIVGYVGRLHTLMMDKGVGALIEAIAMVGDTGLALVGGPDDMARWLYQRWVQLGQPEERFLYPGHVPPSQVPLYISAFDICAMPHPDNEHFARHTSPLKLFEYMAAHRPVVASDLPGFNEVVTDSVNALLVKPGSVTALATALRRLRNNAGLRDFLADSAYRRVMSRYTWDARARLILDRALRQSQQRQSS